MVSKLLLKTMTSVVVIAEVVVVAVAVVTKVLANPDKVDAKAVVESLL